MHFYVSYDGINGEWNVSNDAAYCVNPKPLGTKEEAEAFVRWYRKDQRRRRKPEEQLAVHLAENFGATVDPEALRKFIAENWTTLSRLAHEIHADAVRRAHWGKQCSSI